MVCFCCKCTKISLNHKHFSKKVLFISYKSVISVAQFSHFSSTVLSLPWHSSLTAGAKFSDCGGRTVPLGWHCIATAAGELCHGNGRTLRQRSENCATAARELCDGSKRIRCAPELTHSIANMRTYSQQPH